MTSARDETAAARTDGQAAPGVQAVQAGQSPQAGQTAQAGQADQPFTHLNTAGQARMVDVTEKQPTVRSATAAGFVFCGPLVVAALRDGTTPKGDVLAVARIAGIQGAKKCADLLPLAHVIGVHGAAVDLTIEDTGVRVAATIRTADRTGVEMEALTAVSIAALAVVDMVKGLDKSVSIGDIRLIGKTGGKSGDWLRPSK
ncbi:cyclic pyranopterin monophosphate synthase MoaC [Cryobacterium sp. 5B3]|uniref:cyclic pyranopterin monophosphate synthase MoaC n=1 Tax=unclassified Cryobacterium TaxID=2649013 RepID=UPI003A0FCA19